MLLLTYTAVSIGFVNDTYSVEEGMTVQVCVVKEGLSSINFSVTVFTEQFNGSVSNRAIGTQIN